MRWITELRLRRYKNKLVSLQENRVADATKKGINDGERLIPGLTDTKVPDSEFQIQAQYQQNLNQLRTLAADLETIHATCGNETKKREDLKQTIETLDLSFQS